MSKLIPYAPPGESEAPIRESTPISSTRSPALLATNTPVRSSDREPSLRSDVEAHPVRTARGIGGADQGVNPDLEHQIPGAARHEHAREIKRPRAVAPI